MVNENYGKIPPQEPDIEEAILGALMLETEAYQKVSSIISSETFYFEKNQIIFRCIKNLSEASTPVDMITVNRELKVAGKLETIGGPMYLIQLTNRVASAAHIEHHARIIQQKFIQRELIRIGSETTTESFQDGADIEDIINNLKQKINELENYSIGSSSGQFQSEVLNETIIEIENDCKENEAGRQPGITTGLFDLNQATGGWRRTNLIILAARPGIGKTSLALHFAKMAAQSGKWVNFYGLEMKSTDLARIQISGQSGVNRTSIRDGKMTDRDWGLLNESLPKLSKLPIIWNDNSGITATHIKNITAKNCKIGKCDLVIIDYLQLMTPSDKKQNREQQIGEISRTLKKLALSENIPIIALSQLNREAEGVKPQISHLRESGSLEQDADVIILPWIEDNKYMLTIGKNRRGRVGSIEIHANDEMTCFYDINNRPEPVNFYDPIDRF